MTFEAAIGLHDGVVTAAIDVYDLEGLLESRRVSRKRVRSVGLRWHEAKQQAHHHDDGENSSESRHHVLLECSVCEDRLKVNPSRVTIRILDSVRKQAQCLQCLVLKAHGTLFPTLSC